MTTVVVITAGLSQPSSTRLLGDRLAAAAVAALPEGVEIVHVELRDLARDLTNRMLTHVSPESLEDVLETVERADALIAVSPVFNAAYSGLFKMFFDVLDEGALRGKPVLLGATGGTPRHSLAIDQTMVPLFFYLKASVVPMSVFAATDDWGTSESGLSGRIDAAGRALAEALEGRTPAPRVDPFDDVTPFAELLAR